MRLLWHESNIELLNDKHQVSLLNSSDVLKDAIIDELEISGAINVLENPEIIMSEVKRLIKRNGTVKLHFILIELKHSPFANWQYRHKCKKAGVRYSLEDIEKIIDHSGFIINRNDIVSSDMYRQLNLELISTENEFLSRAVST